MRVTRHDLYDQEKYINRLLSRKGSELRIDVAYDSKVGLMINKTNRRNIQTHGGVESCFRSGLSTIEAYEALYLVEQVLENM